MRSHRKLGGSTETFARSRSPQFHHLWVRLASSRMVSGPRDQLLSAHWKGWRRERRSPAVSRSHSRVLYETVDGVQVTTAKETHYFLPEGYYSRQTISAYIKEAVVLVYLDASLQDTTSPVHIKSHSVRHVATSLSALRNFSLEDVLKTGAWASPYVFIKHYVQSFM